MSANPDRPSSDEDPGASTEMFRAFVESDDAPRSSRRSRPPRGSPSESGSVFRVVTLLAGLAVLALVVYLLLG